MAIRELTRNSTPHRLYANGSPDSRLSKCGSGVAEIILRFKKLNFEKKKINFCSKIYDNSLKY